MRFSDALDGAVGMVCSEEGAPNSFREPTRWPDAPLRRAARRVPHLLPPVRGATAPGICRRAVGSRARPSSIGPPPSTGSRDAHSNARTGSQQRARGFDLADPPAPPRDPRPTPTGSVRADGRVPSPLPLRCGESATQCGSADARRAPRSRPVPAPEPMAAFPSPLPLRCGESATQCGSRPGIDLLSSHRVDASRAPTPTVAQGSAPRSRSNPNVRADGRVPSPLTASLR
jgi:hypothetical protein